MFFIKIKLLSTRNYYNMTHTYFDCNLYLIIISNMFYLIILTIYKFFILFFIRNFNIN